VILKARAFAACNNIIHELTDCLLFDSDMRQVIEAFTAFQQLIAVVLERLSLALSCLYHAGAAGCEMTPRGGRSGG
jgi:hypothetical protein